MNTVKWLFFILVFSGFSNSLFAANAPQPPIPVGRVVWIKGQLKAVMPNNEERLLQNKSIIYLHDTLVTDANSQAELGFTDQTLMTLRENTKFNVTEYQYSSQSKNTQGKSIMNVIEGGFRTITGAVAKTTPNNYAVNTPVATIGVRGTEYQTYTEGSVTYIGYISGTPCIRTKQPTGGCEKQQINAAGELIDEKTTATQRNNNSRAVGSYEVCLNAKTRWVKVAGPCGKPQALPAKPDVFKKDLDLKIMFIEPFNTGTGGGSRNSNNFCIQ